MAPPRVVIDACVLYDAAVRDLLLRLGIAGLVEPVWSDRILDECFAALTRNRPDISAEQRDRLRAAMTRAFPRALVPPRAVDVPLPDPDDVHVVGTALAAGAPVVVTYDLGDYPQTALEPLGLRAVHPDTVASEILSSERAAVVAVLIEHAGALRRPPTTVDRLLATLEARGLHSFVAAVRGGGAPSERSGLNPSRRSSRRPALGAPPGRAPARTRSASRRRRGGAGRQRTLD